MGIKKRRKSQNTVSRLRHLSSKCGAKTKLKEDRLKASSSDDEESVKDSRSLRVVTFYSCCRNAVEHEVCDDDSQQHETLFVMMIPFLRSFNCRSSKQTLKEKKIFCGTKISVFQGFYHVTTQNNLSKCKN